MIILETVFLLFIFLIFFISFLFLKLRRNVISVLFRELTMHTIAHRLYYVSLLRHYCYEFMSAILKVLLKSLCLLWCFTTHIWNVVEIEQSWICAVLWWPFWKWRPVEIFRCQKSIRDIIIYPHIKWRWNRTMLNLCGIVAAILKMETGRNCSMSGINSGHHYLPTYQILMISDNVEFLPPIFYTVFWQPFWKWQTSRNFENAKLLL